MNNNKLASTALRAPYPRKKGLPLRPQVVFLASLSLYLASSQTAANPAVTLPPNPPGLGIEFRCIDVGEGFDCPLDDNDRIAFDDPESKYLQFEAVNPVCSGLEYTPLVDNLLADGMGVTCSGFYDSAGIDADEDLEISVRDVEGIPSSALMDGIYLNHLERGFWNGETCEPSSQGNVIVGYLDEQGVPQPDLIIPWTADTSAEGGEGCNAGDGHAIFVDFDGIRSVTSILIDVTTLDGAEGPVAAGISLPNVNPACFEAGDGVCNIELVDGPLPGQDMSVIIDDEELFGTVSVLDGFPVRVLDPRPSCQEAPSGSPETLEFNGANIYTYYPPGASGPGDEITGALPLVVSDDGSTLYFTLSEKGCGVPRMAFNGPAVARGTPGSMPYFDIIALESDIDPVDSLILYESSNESPYECKPGPIPAPLPLGSALDQPLIEFNSREPEIKQLSGVPGVVDPLSRDKTLPCGSRRGGSDRFSFIGYSLIHNLQTDMRAELDDEIQVLADTVTRTAACVHPSFYYGQLAAYPGYINNYFDVGVDKAVNDCDAAGAGFYFSRTAVLVDRFRYRLQFLGSNGFLRCYATGDNLDEIKASPPMPLLPGDKPLNAYGNILSQLQHLSYSLKTFLNELKDPPDSCP